MAEEKKSLIKYTVNDRSGEVQEIMGYIPNWLVRWGITVIFIAIAIVLLCGWFIKYPDILIGSVTVSSKNPPIFILAKSSGKLEKIFVKDQGKIKNGDVLAVIKNPCSYENFMKLKSALDGFDSNKEKEFKETNNHLILGELQNSYENFIRAYKDYLNLVRNVIFKDELKLLQVQLTRNKDLLQRCLEQEKIIDKDFLLSEKKYKRAEHLFNKGLISQENFDSSKSMLINKEYNLNEYKNKISTIKLQIEELKNNILSLKDRNREDKDKLKLNLLKAEKILRADISLWEHNYLLKSPLNGTLSLTRQWKINKDVVTGDKVFSIIPNNEGKIFGIVLIPINNSGKVKVGQRVNVKLDNYPFVEFGIVGGRVKNISQIPIDKKYLVEIEFNQGLKTSYNKKLKFSHEMSGLAEIITDDTGLLAKIFNNLRSLLYR